MLHLEPVTPIPSGDENDLPSVRTRTKYTTVVRLKMKLNTPGTETRVPVRNTLESHISKTCESCPEDLRISPSV